MSNKIFLYNLTSSFHTLKFVLFFVLIFKWNMTKTSHDIHLLGWGHIRQTQLLYFGFTLHLNPYKDSNRPHYDVTRDAQLLVECSLYLYYYKDYETGVYMTLWGAFPFTDYFKTGQGLR